MTLGTAIAVEARRIAILEVKDALRARGIKVTLLSRREILRQAEVYMVEHRAELREAAREHVERWFGAEFKTSATQTKGRKSSTSVDHILGAK